MCSKALNTDWNSCRRFVVLATVLVALASGLFHWRVLLRTPSNTDELIYLSLAQSISQGAGNTLQGTLILKALPPEMYDHEIFNHPPGFPLLLVPFVSSPRNAVIVPFLAMWLAALSVAWVGAKFVVDRSLAGRLLFVLLLLSAFFDPVLSFCSRRIWMDGLLGMWVGMAYAAMLTRSNKPGIPWALIFAAFCMAAAIGTKLLMGVFLLPLVVLIFLQGGSVRWRDLLILCVPSLLVVGFWEFGFHAATGEWLPKWLSIDANVLRTHPFMAARANQPFLFFPIMFFLLCPLGLLVLPAGLWLMRKSGDKIRIIIAVPLFAIVLYLVVLVGLGSSGFSKEARYLAPAMPLLGMVFAGVLAAMQKPGFRLAHKIFVAACGLAILAGALLAGFHLMATSFDEPISLWTLVPKLFGLWFP